MHRLSTLALCALSLSAGLAAHADNDAVAPNHNPISPGEAVALRWYFTGSKVVVSGGRFGAGAVVTGRTSVIDHPHKTTRYNFDVWYRPNGQRTGPQIHQRYATTVDVMPVKAYADPHGWQIRYLSGWKRDTVPTADEGSDGLTFFQQEDDSVERLAVAVVPVKEGTCSDVMDKVRQDLPSHYDNVKVVSEQNTTHHTYPAVLATFVGNDQTHPGTRTESIVLALVRGNKAYVVSARTDASHFAARASMLEKLVRSLEFSEPQERSQVSAR